MKPSNEDINEIERYLRDVMDEREEEIFTQRLITDTALAEEFKITKAVMANIEQQGDEELRAQIAQVHQKMKAEGVVKPLPKYRSMQRIWLAAAAAVLLLGVFLVDLLSEGNERSEGNSSLFQAYFQPDIEAIDLIRDELLTMGLAATDRSKHEALAAALAYYGEGNYTAADTAIKAFRQQYPEEATARYFQALLNLQHGRVAAATDELESLVRTDEDAMIAKEKIQWYLALAYLRSGATEQLDRARIILNELKMGNSVISEKAKSLIRGLE